MMRSAPTASRMDLATVVLPEPVPPATPRTQGLNFSAETRGSSSGAVSIMTGSVRPGTAERILSVRRSSLAAGTIKGAAPGLDDPPHRPPARQAGSSLAVVDGERYLEVAAAPLAV